jgi:Divergent InlB B-repeat domain
VKAFLRAVGLTTPRTPHPKRSDTATLSARRLAIPASLLAMTCALLVAAAPAGAAEHPFLATFGSAQQPTFTEPAGVAIDQAGDVLVIDGNSIAENGVLKRFKPNGEPDLFTDLGTNVINGVGVVPPAACTPPSAECDGTPEGEILSTEGMPAFEAQVAVAPPGAAGGTAGNIYVTDAFNGVVDVFASSGRYLDQLSGFTYPCGVAVAPNGDVYVGDYVVFGEGRVHKLVPSTNATPPPPTTYTKTGEFMTKETCNVAAGAGPTEGFVFATQYDDDVTKIDSEGAEEGVTKYTVDSGANSSVSVDPATGRVYTTESNDSAEVQEYDASGGSATETSNFEASSEVQGVAINETSGNIYVTAGSQAEVFGPIPKFTLTVNKTGTGSGTVTSSPPGISCGVDCSEPYDEDTVVTLSQTKDAGSKFTGWSGACTGTGTCEVTMSAAKSVTANFDLVPQFTLTVNKPGTGSGTVTSSPPGISCGVDCSEPYDEDTEVTLTATPASDSTFTGWTGCASNPTPNQCKVTMSAAKLVTTTFTLIQRTLTINKAGTGSGSVTCNGGACAASYPSGTTVTLAAAAASDSTFAGWSGGGCSGTGNCVVTLNANTTVTANFTLIQRTLTINKAGTGSGSVTCNGGACAASYADGTKVTLGASAASGSTFAGWSGGGCSGTGPCTVTMSADTTVTATFTANPVLGPPSPATCPADPSKCPPPSNEVKAGSAKQQGSAIALKVIVPGAGAVSASGKNLITAKGTAKAAGTLTLKLKLTSAGKKQLQKKGKLKIKVKIVFTPTGGTAGSAIKTVTFKSKGTH